MRRAVVTGAPGSGKSTLLAEVARRGVATGEEVARAILQAPGGMEMRAKRPTDFALAMLEAHIEPWVTRHGIREKLAAPEAHIIGTSGTVTCVAGVNFGLERYRRDLVDGKWMERESCVVTMTDLIEAGPEGRANFPTIGEERAGLMVAGCALMETVWALAPNARMRVADRGLREGLLLSMMRGPKKQRRRRGGRKRKAGPSGDAKAGADA